MTTAAPAKHAYRPHLDGIRAVAVILVILFHLGYGWARGGFVGVDVFFVLSGYLITSLLVDELMRRGRVDLARFYARRVRRLLPAAALVVAVVIVATSILMDRADQAAVGHDATFSALYGANWRFALSSVDYFAPGDVYSPLIHFWSLGIEEQFYVFWPALLLALWAAIPRARRDAAGEKLLLGAVLALTAVSAALSVLLEPGPLTYYGTHTRAYQLLAGGALAIAALRMAAAPPRGGAAPGDAAPGGAAPGGAAPDGAAPDGAAPDGAAPDGAAPDGAAPGRAAPGGAAPGRAAPSGAAPSGAPRDGASAAGAAAAATAASPRLRATGAATSAAALIALVVLAHEIPNAREYPGWAGIAVTAASVALIAGLDLMGRHPLQRLAGARLPAAIGRLSYSLYLWHWPAIVFMPLLANRFDLGFLGTRPSMAVAMTATALLSFHLWERPMRFSLRAGAPARRVVVAGLAASAVLSLVSIPLLQPSNAFEGRALAAVKDLARPGDCPYFARDWGDPATAHACVRRRGHGLTVALVGDSHSQQWEPALATLARSHDLTVVRATRGGCAPNDTLVDRNEDIRGVTGSGEECAAWRHVVLPDLVQRYDPDLVFVATRSHVAGILHNGREIKPFTREHRRAWSASWDWTLRTLTAGGARIVVSEILPTLPQRVPACLAAAGAPTTACDFPISADRDVGAYNAIVRRLADRLPRIGIFDPAPIACPRAVCRAFAGNVIVHRDDSHLSATFVRSRAERFEAALTRAGARLDR